MIITQLWVALTAGILGTVGSQLGSHFVNTTAGTFFGAFFVSDSFIFINYIFIVTFDLEEICIFANLYARFFKRGLALLPIWSGMLLLVPASIGVKGLLYVR